MRKSNKGFTLVEIMIVVVIIGLLAAIAVPAFSKVRENARTKAVTNNLRIIASAGQQHLLATGVSEVDYSTLIDEGYVSPISKVADEDYTAATTTVTNDSVSISVTLDGTPVVYTF